MTNDKSTPGLIKPETGGDIQTPSEKLHLNSTKDQPSPDFTNHNAKGGRQPLMKKLHSETANKISERNEIAIHIDQLPPYQDLLYSDDEDNKKLQTRSCPKRIIRDCSQIKQWKNFYYKSEGERFLISDF